jgi:hypothetical protein
MDAFGELPIVQGRCLIERLALVFQQRQIELWWKLGDGLRKAA